MTAFGNYSDDETASAMKRRDFKDATDLICSSIYINPVVYDTTQITSPANGSNPKPELCHSLAKGQNIPLLVNDVKQVQWASGGGHIENDTVQTLRSNAEHNYQNKSEENQNFCEWEHWNNLKDCKEISKYLAPCWFISKGGKVLIQAKTEKIDFQKYFDGKIKLPAMLPAFFVIQSFQIGDL